MVLDFCSTSYALKCAISISGVCNHEQKSKNFYVRLEGDGVQCDVFYRMLTRFIEEFGDVHVITCFQ